MELPRTSQNEPEPARTNQNWPEPARTGQNQPTQKKKKKERAFLYWLSSFKAREGTSLVNTFCC